MLRKRDIPYRKPVISFVLLAETWRYGPATWLVFPCFRLFPLLRKYVQKVSYLRKSGFPMGIFLYSYMKLTFEYFSRLTYMQWRLVYYISQTNIYHHKTEIHPCCIWNFIPFPVHRLVSNNAYLWSYLIRRSCKRRDGFKQLHVSVEFTKYGNTLFRSVKPNNRVKPECDIQRSIFMRNIHPSITLVTLQSLY